MSNSVPQCPLCQGPGAGVTFPFGTVWDGRRFDYVRCRRCGSSFIDPLPDAADLKRMYSQDAYHDSFYEIVSEEGAETRLKDALPALPPGGRLLDFGCGNGSFLIAARRAGFICDGVELDEGARARAAVNSGCDVYALEELAAKGARYDIIHLSDVIEHLPDPAATMHRLEGLLADGGLFFVEGPLEDNPSVVFYASKLVGGSKKLLGRNLYAGMPPFHLIRTHAQAQRRFFEDRLGYRVRQFTVYETGFPYLEDSSRLLDLRSTSRFLRSSIGRLGMGAAKFLSGKPFLVGNRFFAVVSPTASR